MKKVISVFVILMLKVHTIEAKGIKNINPTSRIIRVSLIKSDLQQAILLSSLKINSPFF
jgi:hypothetical protein